MPADWQAVIDPFWANKAGEGRGDDIRPCISCNQLFNDLAELGMEAYQVGDAVAAHTAHMAIFEARKLGSPCE